ncbi:uncharacterized protein LOC118201921 [Stegodyphus dumicola]|uniref:uncharacterized protein LOC118201921 n=1 Tax=Stegodyphus dumicola TaxID=202533 RepID=UPI0015B0F17A|nr:uncharacterized protein LOC118201921 [Stegodyphus dumicola]
MMSSPHRLAARPKPRPPPDVRSPGSRSPPFARCPDDSSDLPSGLLNTSSLVSGVSPPRPAASDGAFPGVLTSLPVQPDCSSLTSRQSCATTFVPNDALLDSSAANGLCLHREVTNVSTPHPLPPADGCPLSTLDTPPGPPGAPRHVAAFVTPTVPPLGRSGQICELLRRIRASNTAPSPPLTAVTSTRHDSPIAAVKFPTMHVSSTSSLTSSCHPGEILDTLLPSNSLQNMSSYVSPRSYTSPRVCTICGKAFSQKRKLEKHIRTHRSDDSRTLHDDSILQASSCAPNDITGESPVCHHTRSRTAAGHAYPPVNVASSATGCNSSSPVPQSECPSDSASSCAPCPHCVSSAHVSPAPSASPPASPADPADVSLPDDPDGSSSPRYLRTQNEDSQDASVSRPGCSSDPAGGSPAADGPTDSVPRQPSREESSLLVFFPIPPNFVCTETGCRFAYSSCKWTAQRRSLERHLLNNHDIEIHSVKYFCLHCNNAISGRPSHHSCLANGLHLMSQSETSSVQRRFQCRLCDRSFTSRKGLDNHRMYHRRQDARNRNLATLTSAVLPVSPRASTTSPNDVAPAIASNPDPSVTTVLPPASPCPPLASVAPAPALQAPPASSALSCFLPILDNILNSEVTNDSWDLFQNTLNEIIGFAQGECRLQSSVPTPQRAPVNIDDATALQKLYRRNRRRAARLIMSGNSRNCEIPLSRLEEHFSHTRTDRTFNNSILNSRSPPQISSPINMEPFTEAEVITRLRRFENTAPGPDRLTYNHWRSLDPEGCVLTVLFNICLRFRRIPHSWKNSRSILIYKKGDPDDPNNWRPISLCRTIAKIFSGLLATRLSDWLECNDILHPGQKGFRPFDGVVENNFLLQKKMNDARTQKKDLCVAWMDIADAFGSVPHSAISDTLEYIGAGNHFCSIIKDMYENVSTEFVSNDGTTPPIPVRSGILQGDPLSGVLFVTTMDPILWNTASSDSGAILAYADDVALLASSPAELQSLINKFSTSCDLLSLGINGTKCASLHLTGCRPAGTRPTQFNINGQPIRHLNDGETCDFLGKPVGFLGECGTPSSIERFIGNGRRLLTSKLAPWQRLDAVKNIPVPILHLCNAHIPDS